MGDAFPTAATRPSASDGVGTLADYPPALIEVTLERVMASNTFRRSQRHRQFLAHVIRAALAGHRDRLKEVIIGIEVFGRALPDYDPRRDPIVRVEAGRIRDKLARFYDGEGASESFQIVLPVGNYTPLFVRRRFNPDAGPAPASHSLAVLPFVNLSGDPDDAALALGLADQLIDTIGRVPGLRVVARLSASKARDGGMDLKAIGKLLGVDHVVDGSLQRSGARLRCIAQLSRTKDSLCAWSRRFEHDEDRGDDLFDFQDAVAAAVLAAVSTMNATPAQGPSRAVNDLFPANSGNRQARDLFERARYLSQQRSYEGYDKSIALLERAVELDPGFARAYSHLGSAMMNRIGYNTEPTFPACLKAERAVRKALALDPLDGEARAMLAVIAYRVQFGWSEAEPMFQEALRLAPNSTLVHSSYAWGLVLNGHSDEAMQHARLAQALDPLNFGLRASNAAVAKFGKRFDHAIHEFRAVLQLEPDHFFANVVLGVALLSIGDIAGATNCFELTARLHPQHSTPKFCLVCARGLGGDIDGARRDLDAVVASLGERHYSRVNRAMAEACLGDFDAAFATLEDAATKRDMLFVTVPVHALFATLRDDPRYAALLARHGYAPVVVLASAPPG